MRMGVCLFVCMCVCVCVCVSVSVCAFTHGCLYVTCSAAL